MSLSKIKTEHSPLDPGRTPSLNTLLISGTAEAEATLQPEINAVTQASEAEFKLLLREAGQASRSILSYELQ